MLDKNELRQLLLLARRTADPALRACWTEAICARIQAWLADRQVTAVGVYWPIRDEPDLRALYGELTAAGIRLALPVVVGKAQPLRFAAWTPGDAMETDAFGVAVPATRDFSIMPEALLIPCVGFNRERVRLGYGGGFYDRTLAVAPRPVTLGVAYANAEVLFAGAPHDIALDCIVTESGVLAPD